MNNSSTPLPEQGGFNKRLDEILTAFANGEYSHHWTDNRLVYTKDEAKAAIRTLVLEEIIGEDEAQGVVFNKNSKKVLRPRYKNMLRAEQRRELEEYDGTK